MTNYDNGDDYRNEDGDGNNKAASVSSSGGPIFDMIAIPRYRGGGSGNDGDSTMAAAHYIYNLLKIFHKLLYENFGVFNWCCCHTGGGVPVQLIREYTASLISTTKSLSLSAPSLV